MICRAEGALTGPLSANVIGEAKRNSTTLDQIAVRLRRSIVLAEIRACVCPACNNRLRHLIYLNLGYQMTTDVIDPPDTRGIAEETIAAVELVLEDLRS